MQRYAMILAFLTLTSAYSGANSLPLCGNIGYSIWPIVFEWYSLFVLHNWFETNAGPASLCRFQLGSLRIGATVLLTFDYARAS